MHFYHFWMNFVPLFNKQLPKIGLSVISKTLTIVMIYLYLYLVCSDVYLFYFSPKTKKIKWRTVNDGQDQFIPKWFTEEFPH